MFAIPNTRQTNLTQASLKNLAPTVFRQRLLIEGHFSGGMTERRVRHTLLELAAALDLRTYSEPVVFQPASGMGTGENAGFDAFVPLIDSGISGYFWSAPHFFAILFCTCKGFEAEAAIDQARDLLDVRGEIVAHSF